MLFHEKLKRWIEWVQLICQEIQCSYICLVIHTECISCERISRHLIYWPVKSAVSVMTINSHYISGPENPGVNPQLSVSSPISLPQLTIIYCKRIGMRHIAGYAGCLEEDRSKHIKKIILVHWMSTGVIKYAWHCIHCVSFWLVKSIRSVC